jgi:hypothetical protein
MGKLARGGCRPRSLVRGRVARIEHCSDCGCVSIHVGPTTIRTDEHALRCLWVTLGEAIEAFDEPMSGGYGFPAPRGRA